MKHTSLAMTYYGKGFQKMSELLDYEMFVAGKLSQPSKDFDAMIQALHDLKEQGDLCGVRIPELITAANGISSEGGEIMEIVKKMVWQGKPLNEENRFHLKREAGDLMFYAMVLCIALGYTADEIIEENYEKLNARYEGQFTVEESENRAEGDL